LGGRKEQPRGRGQVGKKVNGREEHSLDNKNRIKPSLGLCSKASRHTGDFRINRLKVEKNKEKGPPFRQ